MLKISISKMNFNLELLTNPNFVYILGLLWADGHIRKDRNHINISMISSDIQTLRNSFFDFGIWHEHNYQPKTSRKQQTTFTMINKEFHKFLLENNYQAKSIASADNILSKISPEFKYYWFRGLVDGDGCFYYNQKHKTHKHVFSIASSKDQDWIFMEKLCRDLDLIYHIRQTINKDNHAGSFFIIQRVNDIRKIGDYLYQNYKIDKIGLRRKFNKFELIKNCNSRPKTSKYNFVWKNRNKFVYDFEFKGKRYIKYGFITDKDAFEACSERRRQLGLPISHNPQNSSYNYSVK